jgi:arylsulfatase A-like enzyme
MFTGLYPSHHGAGVADEVLRDDLVTLAEIFRQHGYVTGGFIGGHMSSSVFGLAQGFSYFHDPDGWERRGDTVTDSAIDFLTSNARAPLFMFINYFDPHEPYAAPEPFQELAGVEARRRAAAPVPVWGDFARGDAAAWGEVRAGRAAANPRGLAFLRSIYLAEVAFMDAQLGRVFETLHELGLFDEALIVVVADHGELLGERGRYSHSYSLDPELTMVPLVVKWPGQRRQVNVDALVSHVDLFPAIAAAAGLETPATDGRLFSRQSLSLLEERELVFMEEHASRIHPLPGRLWISDHLFGIQRRRHREVLFDGTISCSARRGQQWMQVPCSSTWEERFAMLSDDMQASARLGADHRAEDLDPREAEKLRALGYIE